MARPRTAQTGRMRKIECARCGAILYGSASALREPGLPSCACGGRFRVSNMRDVLAIYADELAKLSPAARDALKHFQTLTPGDQPDRDSVRSAPNSK